MGRGLTLWRCYRNRSIAKSFARHRISCSAAMFAAAAFAVTTPQSRAADPQPYVVDLGKTGNGALDQALHDSSNLVSLRESAPVGPFALVERAREDGGRFVTALHSFGYYKGSVDITIAGHELEDRNLPELLSRATAAPPVTVTVSPQLGPLFHIRKVDLQGVVPAKVRAQLGLAPGAPARAQDVLAAQTRLLDALRANGYALAKVPTPTVIEDPAANSLDVTYMVTAGPRVDFGRISVKGLRAVNRDFIEKRLLIHPGEQFSPQAVEKARADLASLGVFSSVQGTTSDKLDAEGRIPIEFDVVERPAHAVSFSAAYSTDLGVGLTASWSDRNLFGNAEQLNLSAAVQGGGTALHGPANNVTAQFIKPDFLDRNQSLQVDAGAVRQNLLAYDQNAVSADISAQADISHALERLDRDFRRSRTHHAGGDNAQLHPCRPADRGQIRQHQQPVGSDRWPSRRGDGDADPFVWRVACELCADAAFGIDLYRHVVVVEQSRAQRHRVARIDRDCRRRQPVRAAAGPALLCRRQRHRARLQISIDRAAVSRRQPARRYLDRRRHRRAPPTHSIQLRVRGIRGWRPGVCQRLALRRRPEVRGRDRRPLLHFVWADSA